MRVTLFDFLRAKIRFCHFFDWNSAIISVVMVVSFSGSVPAQDFEEISDHPMGTTGQKSIQTERVIPQQLPAVASPNDFSASESGIVLAGGVADKPGQIVSAQYQAGEQGGLARLPSIQLAQGSIPRLASVDKNPPAPMTYPGAGQITLQETDGTTPNVTRRPTSQSVQELAPPAPPASRNRQSTSNGNVVNAFSSPDEIVWDQDGTQQENYDSYETLPRHLGHISGYGSEYMGQYGIQGEPLVEGLYDGAMYGDGMYAGNEYYGYGQGTYGQGMYGYGYGGYPGGCPPMYSQGLVGAVFSQIMCSNAWENLTIGFGGSGFKSPLDQAHGGAFGFSETLNWASPSTMMTPINFQAGVRAVQAFPSGYNDYYSPTWHRSSREQYFGTIGIFRRNIWCTPLNIGVAYDMMNDKQYGEYDLEQVRAELSYGGLYGYEFGYRGAFNMRNDSIWLTNTQKLGVRTVDYHTLFVKKYFANGGEGSFAGGATEYGDFMIRAEYSIPLSNEWGLKNSFSYIVPKSGHAPSSPQRESWDVSLQLVYQPRGGMLAGFCNPFRALFDVADNGTMLQRRR